MEIYGPPARMLREIENLFGVALLALFKVSKNTNGIHTVRVLNIVLCHIFGSHKNFVFVLQLHCTLEYCFVN